MELDDYMSNGENLPEFIKDFHDQKDLFKTIYDQYREGNAKKLLTNVNWVDAHCFTIDVFLWWMGRHGYKLQKTRKQGVEFNDPTETIKHFTDKRHGRTTKMFEDILK
jgi:hypothetical protein